MSELKSASDLLDVMSVKPSARLSSFGATIALVAFGNDMRITCAMRSCTMSTLPAVVLEEVDDLCMPTGRVSSPRSGVHSLSRISWFDNSALERR